MDAQNSSKQLLCQAFQWPRFLMRVNCFSQFQSLRSGTEVKGHEQWFLTCDMWTNHSVKELWWDHFGSRKLGWRSLSSEQAHGTTTDGKHSSHLSCLGLNENTGLHEAPGNQKVGRLDWEPSLPEWSYSLAWPLLPQEPVSSLRCLARLDPLVFSLPQVVLSALQQLPPKQGHCSYLPRRGW